MKSENERLLRDYLDSRDVKPNTRMLYQKALASLDGTGAVLVTATAKELKAWWTATQRTKDKEGNPLKPLKASTVCKYADCMRRMLQYWLKKQGHDKRTAKNTAEDLFDDAIPLSDLRSKASKDNHFRDMIVKPDEFKKLLQATKHSRTKALVATLYDSACRKGEILDLRIKHVEFKDLQVNLHVTGKTGERNVPIRTAIPYLKAWLQVHPDPRPDQYLFATSIKGKVGKMSEHSVNNLMAVICKKTGMRHIHPHMLRHTRLTELAALDIGEYNLKSFAGWSPGSRMAARYIHFSGRGHMKAWRRAEGFPAETVEAEEIPRLIELVLCPNCGAEVAPTIAFCTCGFCLDERVGVTSILGRDKEIQKMKDELEEVKRVLTVQKEVTGFHYRRAELFLDEIFSNPELMKLLDEKMAKAFEDEEAEED